MTRHYRKCVVLGLLVIVSLAGSGSQPAAAAFAQLCEFQPAITGYTLTPTGPITVGTTVTMAVEVKIRYPQSVLDADPGGPPSWLKLYQGCDLDFYWYLASQPSGSAVYFEAEVFSDTLSFVPDVPGTYVIVVGVFNPYNESGNEIVITIDVVACTEAPAVNVVSVSPGTSVTPGETVQLLGDATNPELCQQLVQGWQLAARPAGSLATLSATSGASTALTTDVAGTYQVVFSGQNEFDTASRAVTIQAGLSFETETEEDGDSSGGGEAGGPSIGALNPSSGVPGTTVVISGTGFSPVFEENLVYFGTVQAQVLSATATTLTVLVPNLPEGVYAVTVTVATKAAILPGAAGRLTLTAAPTFGPPAPVLAQAAGGGSNIILFEIDDSASLRSLTTLDVDAGFMVGDVLIFFREGVSQIQIEALQEEFGFKSLVRYASLGFYRGRVEASTIDETVSLVERLNQDPRVDEAFLNALVDILQADEPQLGAQDWLLSLGLPAGYETAFPNEGAGVTIAVIDTGADLTLPNADVPELRLPAAAPQGMNFSPKTDDNTAQDELGHGTIVSTIATAAANGYNGLGVAPRAEVLPLKIFTVVDGQIKATNEGVAQALLQAFQLEADVINLSLGCQGCSADSEQTLRSYYKKVLDNLIANQKKAKAQLPIIVAASGNDGENLIDSPAAAHPDVIAVGSLKPDHSGRSRFSNYGPELEFVAVGEGASTTLLGGRFADGGSGTSFAAPQVSGFIALILAERPGLGVDEVRELIKTCFIEDVGPAGFDEETGWGRIVVPAALAPGCAG